MVKHLEQIISPEAANCAASGEFNVMKRCVMTSRLKRRLLWNVIISALIGVIGYTGYSAGFDQPWEGMAAGGWWMYLILSISIVVILDFKTILSSLTYIEIPNVFGQRKKEEEMLRVNKLYKEGILTKDEYDRKIATLKQRSGY